ncbi:MAG: acyl-CoA dehydrogenase family protein, partial [Halioglobus sp.]
MSTIGNTTISFSEEQAMLMNVAREFCRDKSPIGEVRDQLETPTGFDQAIWDEMVNLGWSGIALPESCGGSGLGVAALVPVVEAMGRAMLGTPLIATSLAAQLLLRAAGEATAERWLAGIAGGEIATIALLDGGDWGADNTGLALADDGTLSGAKRFVQDAAVAQLFVVLASRDGAPALAVVRREQLSDDAFSENTLIDQTRRSANIDFTGVHVAAEDVIAGAAVASALRDTQLLGALLVAVEATGTTSACLDTIVEYLTTRKQFGKLIGSYQALKHPTVDILVSLDSSRSFIYHA